MTSTGPRPLFSAAKAVAHALSMRGRGVYLLGTGDFSSNNDDPRDCFGFAYNECYGVKRHRPGYNRAGYTRARLPSGAVDEPDVVDDMNCNSAIGDARHARELFEPVTTPAPGVLLVYPTIHLVGHPLPFIGHVAIVVGVSRCLEWDVAAPHYALLDVVQCHGPDNRRPGVVATDGSVWDAHDRNWPKPEHRTVMLRPLP
jgi:hypothetical protein